MLLVEDIKYDTYKREKNYSCYLNYAIIYPIELYVNKASQKAYQKLKQLYCEKLNSSDLFCIIV